ncbi:g61 [Coccomyxa viridis]|uniref:G61 protein n=1 Tax=Coccomyxa viridis TaxID=1274662 RepID=A0ABP1FIX2_9CHLO
MKWTRLDQSGQVPLARSSHSITAVGSKCYVFGGEHEPRTPIDSALSEYDFETGQWAYRGCTGEIPSPRVGHTAALVGQSLYIFGGRSGIEMGRLSDLHSFDCESGTWEPLRSSEAIKGRGGAGLVASASGDALFVIGGFAGYELNDVHRFELAAGTWDCPDCCSGLAKERWSKLPARSVFGVAPHAASCSACTHGGHLVLFGGEVNPSDQGHAGAGQFCNDMYCYDPNKADASGSGGWHKLQLDSGSVPPTPRGWFAACATAQGLLVHGGNSPSNERLSDMYLLDLHLH